MSRQFSIKRKHTLVRAHTHIHKDTNLLVRRLTCQIGWELVKYILEEASQSLSLGPVSRYVCILLTDYMACND